MLIPEANASLKAVTAHLQHAMQLLIKIAEDDDLHNHLETYELPNYTSLLVDAYMQVNKGQNRVKHISHSLDRWICERKDEQSRDIRDTMISLQELIPSKDTKLNRRAMSNE